MNIRAEPGLPGASHAHHPSPSPSPTPWGQVWALPLPVVVSVIPVVKVNQEAAVHHVGHTGHADEGWVHAVHSLQLHAHLEAQGWGTLGARRGAAMARPRLACAGPGPTGKGRGIVSLGLCFCWVGTGRGWEKEAEEQGLSREESEPPALSP